MTAIVLDEGTLAEKLYMGGGYNPYWPPGGNFTHHYPKHLAVYDADTKTWRLLCYITLMTCNYSLVNAKIDISGKTAKLDHCQREESIFYFTRKTFLVSCPIKKCPFQEVTFSIYRLTTIAY